MLLAVRSQHGNSRTGYGWWKQSNWFGNAEWCYSFEPNDVLPMTSFRENIWWNDSGSTAVGSAWALNHIWVMENTLSLSLWDSDDKGHSWAQPWQVPAPPPWGVQVYSPKCTVHSTRQPSLALNHYNLTPTTWHLLDLSRQLEPYPVCLWQHPCCVAWDAVPKLMVEQIDP